MQQLNRWTVLAVFFLRKELNVIFIVKLLLSDRLLIQRRAKKQCQVKQLGADVMIIYSLSDHCLCLCGEIKRCWMTLGLQGLSPPVFTVYTDILNTICLDIY